jgi:hypothetical protein
MLHLLLDASSPMEGFKKSRVGGFKKYGKTDEKISIGL